MSDNPSVERIWDLLRIDVTPTDVEFWAALAEVWDEGNSVGYREGRGGDAIYSTYDDDRNPYRERVNYLKDLRD